MLDAVEEALEFTRGKNRKDLEEDRKLSLSLLRLIEVLGEAAAQVTKEFQKEHLEIPWSEIIGMRNRLIHAYFDVDLDRVWDTVLEDIPALETALKKLIPKA